MVKKDTFVQTNIICKMNNLLFGLGFHSAPFELYFKTGPNYSDLDIDVNMLDTIAEMSNTNICILDFYKHCYFYVSKNHLFLCGHSSDEATSIGESFVEEIIFDMDKKSQIDMKDAACLFFAELSPSEQCAASLFTSHRLKHKNGAVFMVSNQYRPLRFDDNNKMWMTLCISNIATKNTHLESYISIVGKDEKYIFSYKKKTFVPSKNISLSPKEKLILHLSARGYLIKEIAEKMYISQSTVKFHRHNIFLKLNVDNITEAIKYNQHHSLQSVNNML